MEKKRIKFEKRMGWLERERERKSDEWHKCV